MKQIKNKTEIALKIGNFTISIQDKRTQALLLSAVGVSCLALAWQISNS